MFDQFGPPHEVSKIARGKFRKSAVFKGRKDTHIPAIVMQ